MVNFIFWVTVICVVNAIPAKGDTCNPGFDSPVYFQPEGATYVAEGDPVELVCTLKESEMFNYSLNPLEFDVNPKPQDWRFERVNDSAIRLFTQKTAIPVTSAEWRYIVLCQLNHLKVCSKSITVGRRPQRVTNFTCISYNMQYMECTWDEFINAPAISTTFHLEYNFFGYTQNCTSNSSTCKIGPEYYSPIDQYYNFTMEISNMFGSYVQPLGTIDTWAFMLPAPMERLASSNIQTHSACISWVLNWGLEIFEPGLVYRITYTINAAWSDHGAYDVDTSSLQPNIKEMCVRFPSGNTEYLISVSARSSLADASNEQLWSTPSELIVKTLPDRPCAPPNASLGSFSVIDTAARQVTIYWSPIEPQCENGPEAGYVIQQLDSKGIEIISENVTSTSITSHVFSNLLSSESYIFRIRACNQLGCSDNGTDIFVPKNQAMPSAPKDVRKVYYGGTNYEVQWSLPSSQKQAINTLHIYNKDYARAASISSFTIFWCHSISDIPMTCQGNVSWLTLPGTQTSANVTVPDTKNYQFAVQTNQGNYSSGMVVSSCALYAYGNSSKVESQNATGVTNTSMTIEWSLPCEKRYGIVTGYKIYYCVLDDDDAMCEDASCKGTEMQLSASAEETSKSVENLKPFTWYKVSISVITRSGEGEKSDSIFTRTKEGVPTTPGGLQTLDVSNHSISLGWKPPENLNGNDPSYKILINDYVVSTKKILITLDENISSYTNYVISIEACHDLPIPLCSAPCEPISVMTLIGAPSEPIHVKKMDGENPADITITWSPPSHQGGPNNTYNVRFEYSGDTKDVIDITNLSINEKIASNSCPSGSNYSVQIQAVNRNEDGELLLGAWTAPEKFRCPSPGMELGSVLAITVSVATVVVATFAGINYWKQRRQIVSKAGTTAILLPWEIPNIRVDETKNIANEGKTARDVHDPTQGYRRLQADSSSSSENSTDHSENRLNRVSGSSSSVFDSDSDSVPSSPDIDEIVKNETPFRSLGTNLKTGAPHPEETKSPACNNGISGLNDHKKDEFSTPVNISPYVQLGDRTDGLGYLPHSEPNGNQMGKSQNYDNFMNGHLVNAKKVENAVNQVEDWTDSSGYDSLGDSNGTTCESSLYEKKMNDHSVIMKNVNIALNKPTEYVILSEMQQIDSLTAIPTSPTATKGYVALGEIPFSSVKNSSVMAPKPKEEVVNNPIVNSDNETKTFSRYSPSLMLKSKTADSCINQDKDVLLHIIPTPMKSGGCLFQGAVESNSQSKETTIMFYLQDSDLTKIHFPPLVSDNVDSNAVADLSTSVENPHYVRLDVSHESAMV